MASKPVEPFDVVVVTWVDAYTESSAAAASPQEARNQYADFIRKTTGYFVYQDEAVVITADSDDRSKTEPNRMGGFTFIPACLVKSIARPKNKRVPKS